MAAISEMMSRALGRPLCRSGLIATGTSRWNSTVGPSGTGPSPSTAIASAWFGSHQRVIGSELFRNSTAAVGRFMVFSGIHGGFSE